MDITSLQSTLNKATEQFKNGLAKACVGTLDEMLHDLKIGEPEWYRLRNDTAFLLGRLSGLERERGMISEQNYMVEWNKLFHSTNLLLLDFEAGVKEMEKKEKAEEPGLYPAELVLGLDYKKTDMAEVKRRILRIEKILNIGRDLPNRIIGTRPGSVIVKVSLYAEEIVKIKSLVKLGVLDDMLEIKVFDDAWNWIKDDSKFVLFLPETDFSFVDFEVSLTKISDELSKINPIYVQDFDLINLERIFHQIHMKVKHLNINKKIEEILTILSFMIPQKHQHRTRDFYTSFDILKSMIHDLTKYVEIDLIGANFNRARLKGVKLTGAYLCDSDLRYINLSEAKLDRADLSGANLRRANLNGASLINTVLNRTNLEEASLLNTIFHVDQAQVLQLMDVDISEVIFVDDQEMEVGSLIEVK